METEFHDLVHKVSNLLGAIYAFGEPALQTGEGMREALAEILRCGEQVERTLREAKEQLRGKER